MLISTKGRYALRVMIDFAENRGPGYTPLRGVAERQGISEKYLESIIKSLVQAKLLEGVRGKGGGYRLTREPEEYTAEEIIRLADGELAPVSCLGDGAAACPRAGECRTLPMWEKLDALITDFLSGYTLRDFMEEKNAD